MKINCYTSKGTSSASQDFPENWEEKANDKLLAQAIRVYESALHPGLSKVKTRGEVSYSTRKIYRQKGTGLARHGDRGAPIFVKGGVAHGPTGVKRKLSLPRKMCRKALKVALTMKAKAGEIFFIDKVNEIIKTKDAAGLIDKITEKEKAVNKNSRFTFVLAEKNKNVARVVRNLDNSKVALYRNLNAYKVFFGGVLLIDKNIFKVTDKPKTGKTNKLTVSKTKGGKK